MVEGEGGDDVSMCFLQLIFVPKMVISWNLVVYIAHLKLCYCIYI